MSDIMTVAPPRQVAYRRLAAELLGALRAGKYADGRRLPTEEELVTAHAVSRQTVRRAMQELVAEGAIYRVAGRGTYATEDGERYVGHLGSLEELMSISTETQSEVIAPLRRTVHVDAAGRLRLASDEIFALEVVRLRHELPICLTRLYLTPAVGDRLRDLESLTTIGYRNTITVLELIDRHTENSLARVDQSVTAVATTNDVAEHLECNAGDPTLRIDRMYFDRDDKPAALSISHYDPAHYSYRLSVGRRPSL